MENFKRSLRKDMYTNILLQDECEKDIDISEIERTPKLEDDDKVEVVDFKFENLVHKFEKYAVNEEKPESSLVKVIKNVNSAASLKSNSDEKNVIIEKKEEELKRTPSVISFLENEAACLATPKISEQNNSSNNNEQVMEDLIKMMENLKITDDKDVREKDESYVHEMKREKADKSISMTSFACQVSIHELKTSALVQTTNTPANISNNPQSRCDLIEKRLSAPALLQTNSTVISEEPRNARPSVHLSRQDTKLSPSRELNADKSSRLMLFTRASDLLSNINTRPLINAPCEREFHTIHIEAVSSPPSSVLRREPLCTRFWNVCCDFCVATCICLQVNKPCLFCLLMFFVFFVTSYLLIFIIYGILNADSRMLEYNAVTLDSILNGGGQDQYIDNNSNRKWTSGPTH